MGIIDYLISNKTSWQRELRRSESAVSTVLDMVLPSERLSRSLKSPNTLDTSPHSAVRTPSREKPLVSGNATELTRRLPVVLINSLLPSPSTPRPPFNV